MRPRPITRKGWTKLSTTVPVDLWRKFQDLCERYGILASDELFLLVSQTVEEDERKQNGTTPNNVPNP